VIRYLAVPLPESMFYNTGIGTYVWVVTNRKERQRKGKIQLLDARDVWTAGGSEDTLAALSRIRSLSMATIVLKRGPMGCAALSADQAVLTTDNKFAPPLSTR